MDRNVKTDADNRDKAYYARCINELKKWGAPLDGWRCIGVEDVREDDPEADLFECELCGCSNVRFVHVMDHDLYFEEVRVGCICAGVMAVVGMMMVVALPSNRIEAQQENAADEELPEI